MERLIFIFRQLHAVILKRKLIFVMQFPFLPVGVKWKVVKNVHCSPGLMHIETACAGQCLLHRAKTIKRKAVKHVHLYPFGGHTV